MFDESAPLAKLTNLLVFEAARSHSSAVVFLWGGKEKPQAFMQVNGELIEMDTPRNLVKSIMSRFKMVSGLSISDDKNLQKQKYTFRMSPRKVVARTEIICIPPSILGGNREMLIVSLQ